MQKLIIASNNPGKIREIKQILAPYFAHILSLAEAGVDADADETGQTFAENACIKARAVCRMTGCAALSDDSGLEVDVLAGAPGVYSARYCGRHGDDDGNNQKLVRAVAAYPEEQRTARYVCAVCLCYPDGRELVAQGSCEGVIRTRGAGDGGFGYDPYFYLPERGCTMAQLPADVKNTLSHRYFALRNLLRLLDGSDA
ncbi:MAG: XTP/dITP diphosphatase [Eubacteriales bacterium]|nr:XTP/dITP diphosphatase [Eubacteriales bacterium]